MLDEMKNHHVVVVYSTMMAPVVISQTVAEAQEKLSIAPFWAPCSLCSPWDCAGRYYVKLWHTGVQRYSMYSCSSTWSRRTTLLMQAKMGDGLDKVRIEARARVLASRRLELLHAAGCRAHIFPGTGYLRGPSQGGPQIP